MKRYHYTESGLDNVYLLDGFTIVETPKGHLVSIRNVEGLHEAIGRDIAMDRPRLSGKEFRFLRHEMLLSQERLARLLDVTPQTVARWEKSKVPVPGPAEAVVRKLYLESIGDKSEIRALLEELAELDDKIDCIREEQERLLTETNSEWELAAA